MPDDVEIFGGFQPALEHLSAGKYTEEIERVFVIGGSSLYGIALQSRLVETLHLTRVRGDFDCDVFFPDFSGLNMRLVSESDLQREGELSYRFLTYQAVSRVLG